MASYVALTMSLLMCLLPYFVMDEDLFGTITVYHSFVTLDNESDHIALICSLDMHVAYFNNCENFSHLSQAGLRH